MTVVFIPFDPARDPGARCFSALPARASFSISGAGFDGVLRVVGAPPGA